TFSPGPLAHGLALYAMTETLAAGGEFIAAPHFDAAAAAALVTAHEVRRLVLVPTMLRRICDSVSGTPLRSVTAATVAGAKLTVADRQAAARALPQAAIREYYGASELGFVSVTDPADPPSPTAVGRAFPGVGLSVRDEAGLVLPAGETGTIFVDSPLISDGYLAGGDGAGFRRLGVLATVGDLGFLDQDGMLHLIGRAGGMLVSGGNNIYPSEIEAVLVSMPGIRSAFACGLEHADLGTELVAVIEPDGVAPDADALALDLAARLPRYKHPRRMWLCRSMPMTGSGKVAAKTVRHWIAEESDDLERLF
ncbi:AMP-binding protein, partial [Rhizobium sp. TRM95111]|uniref:AMP-binding protein n=1 Tax=Rhizobium alarense TaxID=2846851 RepID=UPI001F1B67DF